MQWLIDIITEKVLDSFKGIIVTWSGVVVDIPTGWALCDGTQGTPDLTGQFVRGAGGPHIPGATGGSLGHGHALTLHHYHIPAIGSGLVSGPGRDNSSGPPINQDTAILTGHLPPYYLLCKIMKL